MLDWFNYRSVFVRVRIIQKSKTHPFAEFKIYQWVRMNTVDLLSGTSQSISHKPQGEVWKERKDAEAALHAYLSDMPSTYKL